MSGLLLHLSVWLCPPPCSWESPTGTTSPSLRFFFARTLSFKLFPHSPPTGQQLERSARPKQSLVQQSPLTSWLSWLLFFFFFFFFLGFHIFYCTRTLAGWRRDSNSDKTLTGCLQVQSQIQMLFFAVVLADPVSWLHYCTEAPPSLFSHIICWKIF